MRLLNDTGRTVMSQHGIQRVRYWFPFFSFFTKWQYCRSEANRRALLFTCGGMSERWKQTCSQLN